MTAKKIAEKHNKPEIEIDILRYLEFHRNKWEVEKEQYANEKDEPQLQRLYEWLINDNREPAQTKFTAGWLRNVAKEIEYRMTK